MPKSNRPGSRNFYDRGPLIDIDGPFSLFFYLLMLLPILLFVGVPLLMLY